MEYAKEIDASTIIVSLDGYNHVSYSNQSSQSVVIVLNCSVGERTTSTSANNAGFTILIMTILQIVYIAL